MGTFFEDYCGDEIPPRITTTTNIARVRFRSTYWDPWKTTTHSGFLARYNFINGIDLNEPRHEKISFYTKIANAQISCARLPQRLIKVYVLKGI